MYLAFPHDLLTMPSLEGATWSSCTLRALGGKRSIVSTNEIQSSKAFAHRNGTHGFQRLSARLGNPEDTP